MKYLRRRRGLIFVNLLEVGLGHPSSSSINFAGRLSSKMNLQILKGETS
jgi:hypothetical protein